jgi:hypothetical protein
MFIMFFILTWRYVGLSWAIIGIHQLITAVPWGDSGQIKHVIINICLYVIPGIAIYQLWTGILRSYKENL